MNQRRRTLFTLVFWGISEEDARCIRTRLLDRLPRWAEWYSWRYQRLDRSLRVTGKAHFSRPECPAAELCDLSTFAWDAAERLCPVFLILNPHERGERCFVADERHYRDYLRTRKETRRVLRESWLHSRRRGMPRMASAPARV